MFKRSFFYRYLSPYTWLLLLNVLLRTLGALFTVLLLLGVAPLLTVLFQASAAPTQEMGQSKVSANLIERIKLWVEISMQENGQEQTLYIVVIAVITLYFLKNLFSYLGLYFFTPIRNGAIEKLRNDVYFKLLILPLSFYSLNKKGDLLSRLSSDIQEIDETILKQIQQFLIDIVLFIIMFIALFLISVPLTIAVLLLLPIAGGATATLSKSLRKASPKMQSLSGNLSCQLEESIQGIKNIKSYYNNDFVVAKYKQTNSLFSKLKTFVYRRSDLSSPLSEFIGTLSIVILLLLGGFLILKDGVSMPAEALITYLITLTQIINPAKNLSTAFYSLQRGKASVRRIKDILYAEEKICEKEMALPINEFKNEIEFKNLYFSYGTNDVLKNINLKIKKGEHVAIVGPSGSGKSTLIDLIPRFYDCTSGELLLDGVNIQDYKIDNLRNLSAIVSQETILFNDTIFNNISMGRDVNYDTVVEAAKRANAHDFIMATEHGYQTNIGDGGTKLSGGQRQRLSIARAILKQTPILILDEATSALDTLSEKQVQEAIFSLSQEKTVISIAHRLSTIKDANEIIVIDKACIVERGTHKELLKKGGLYAHLCEMEEA